MFILYVIVYAYYTCILGIEHEIVKLDLKRKYPGRQKVRTLKYEAYMNTCKKHNISQLFTGYLQSDETGLCPLVLNLCML